MPTDPTPRAREDALERLRVAILTSNQSDALDAWLHVNSELRTLRAAPAEAEGELPYDAVSVNGRAMEWMTPLWDAINARNWKEEGHLAPGRMADVARVTKAVERAMEIARGAKGEVSEAMVEAALAFGGNGLPRDPGATDADNIEANREFCRGLLAAALRAARAGGEG